VGTRHAANTHTRRCSDPYFNQCQVRCVMCLNLSTTIAVAPASRHGFGRNQRNSIGLINLSNMQTLDLETSQYMWRFVLIHSKIDLLSLLTWSSYFRSTDDAYTHLSKQVNMGKIIPSGGKTSFRLYIRMFISMASPAGLEALRVIHTP
jgi:hypothetical protein